MEGDPCRSRRQRLKFDNDLFTVVVGSTEKVCTVHAPHIRRTSPFFQAALKTVWKEGRERRMALPDDDAELVALYLHHAYTGKLTVLGGISNASTSEARALEEHQLLVKSYVFGEKYGDLHYKNACIDGLIAMSIVPDESGDSWSPTKLDVDVIYNGTLAGSPGRRWMVDLHVLYAKREWLENHVSHPEFVLDLARKLVATRSSEEENVSQVQAKDACAYHEHVKGKACRSRMVKAAAVEAEQAQDGEELFGIADWGFDRSSM